MKERRIIHYEWSGERFKHCYDAAAARDESTLTEIVGYGFGNSIFRCWSDGTREPISRGYSATLTLKGTG